MSGDIGTLITALSQFGGLGIVIAFLVWKDIRSDKARERADESHRAALLLMEERRLNYDKDRLDTDKQIAATLAALNSSIQSIGKR